MTSIPLGVGSYVKKLALGTLLLVPCASPAQQAPRERFPAALDRYIARVLVDGQIPGLAIAVVRNDSVLVAKGYGVRELGKRARVDANTVFDAASLTKSFTATLAALLVDRGQLHWDDPVRRFLPELGLADSTLTLRDFLSHRSGLESANMAWVLTAVDRGEMLRRVRYLRAVTPPRQTMLYNNLGYMISGEAIASAAGRPYAELLRDLILKPLRLRSTTSTYEHAARMPNVVTSHAIIAGRQQPIRRETQREVIAAAGDVQSTVTDLARWMRLHLNNGVLDGVRYVSDSTMRAMHTLQVVIPTTPAMRAARLVRDTVAGYGLGLQVMDYRGHPLLWHTGGGDGQMAYMALLPRDRLGVVVLVNTWAVPLIHAAIVNRILDAYLGYEPRDWAGETLARVPAQRAAADSAALVMKAMRSATPPPLPLAAYASRYDNPLYGPIWVRRDDSGLTLQMGKGQIADLEYHGGQAFFVRWRDPLYRENYGTHVEFTVTGDSVTSLAMRVNRDSIVATSAKRAAWRPSWPGTAMAVVSGDPFGTRGGPFVFRFHMPAAYLICPHTHPVTPQIEVISGSFIVGRESRRDTARVTRLAPGDAITLPTGEVHWEGSPSESVIEVSGMGPWGIRFVDSRYDPASAGAIPCTL